MLVQRRYYRGIVAGMSERAKERVNYNPQRSQRHVGMAQLAQEQKEREESEREQLDYMAGIVLK